MADETQDRDDTPAREAEKREAREKDTEPSSPADRANGDNTTDDAVLDAGGGHIPTRSD
jgi:hypothetical protein